MKNKHLVGKSFNLFQFIYFWNLPHYLYSLWSGYANKYFHLLVDRRTPLKSPSFCVRLTPPLRSPSDFRRLSSKLAEELLTNQTESSQTETPSTTNISEAYVEEHVHSLVDDVVGVFKLTTRKKHNSARYFPSITPQRPTRKRSSTADQGIQNLLLHLFTFSYV
jgi:hypothetical protein